MWWAIRTCATPIAGLDRSRRPSSPNALGTFGNAGYNSLIGPGCFDLDANLTRQFQIREQPAVRAAVRIFQPAEPHELQYARELVKFFGVRRDPERGRSPDSFSSPRKFVF